MTNNEVEKLPPINKWLGSCPECGKPIWDSDLIKQDIIKQKIYRCIECKTILLREAIIPF